MNKYIVVVLMLLFSTFASAQTGADCGTRKQMIVIPKSQPISFEFSLGDGKTITSQKFIVGEKYEEYFKYEGTEYLLKVSQMGRVEFIYSSETITYPGKVEGWYEYEPVGDGECAQTRSISKWRFIKVSS